jgi:hypothetical protein
VLFRSPFDNSVVFIDEAHNLVSSIVNKMNKPKSLSSKLYHYLASATNAKIVLLSGTPIINYPNEIGILFNILRGYIKTWTFKVNVETEKTINTDTIMEMFANANLKTYDYVEYTNNTLTITRNPFGFINTTKSAEKPSAKKTLLEKTTQKIGDKIGKVVGGFSAFFSGGKTQKSKKGLNTKTKKVRFEETRPKPPPQSSGYDLKEKHKIIILAILFFIIFSDIKVKTYLVSILVVIFGDFIRITGGGISKVGLLFYSLLYGLALLITVTLIDLSSFKLAF